MNKERIAIITEGDVRELEIFDNIRSIFFKMDSIDIIALPAGENIYMLWKQLKDDDFQTDIIEIVREQNDVAAKVLDKHTRDDFSEIYLFFDYDGHQDNLSDEEEGIDVLEQMLGAFDNETENGLLYVSYPMAESVRDYVEDDCAVLGNCYVLVDDFSDYKHISSKNHKHNKLKSYGIVEWEDITDSFARRLSCLLGREEVLSYSEYKREVTPESIYIFQKQIIEHGKAFTLCAFPEFLLDYHKETFWRKMVKHKKNRIRECGENRPL